MTIVYPNHHVSNPFYSNPLRGNPANMNAAIACSLFCNAISQSYLRLNTRRSVERFIERASEHLAQAEAEYEKELVRLSPPVIPSQGPPTFQDIRDGCVDKLDLKGKTLCQVFAEETVSKLAEVTPAGKLQYVFEPIVRWPGVRQKL